MTSFVVGKIHSAARGQAYELDFPFVENVERFILYCLCGCFLGITIILLTVSIVLYIDQRHDHTHDEKKPPNVYQIPRADLAYDVVAAARPYVPIYRYDGRNRNELCHV